RQAKPAILAQHARARGLDFRRGGPGITVDVVNVASMAVGPAAGAVDQPRWVVFLNPGGDAVGVELTPAFVERHPHDDARMIPAPIDQGLEFLIKFPRGLRGALDVRFGASDVTVAAGHVLPDEQAKL